MSRSNGTYTAPTSGWKPALEGSVIDSSDWNTLLDDVEAAVTETVYTGGLGATDNAMARTDGTDTKKAQGSTPTISDTGVIAGVATFLLTSYTIGTLPVGTEGQIAYASDWDVNGGASSGSLVFFDGEAWRGVDTGTTTSGVAAPYNTVLPVISGTTLEGETLSTTTGTWLQSPTSYAYQWKRDGVSIGGATASTYGLVSADVGAMITVTVTATNAAGSTGATSAAVGPIEAPLFLDGTWTFSEASSSDGYQLTDASAGVLESYAQKDFVTVSGTGYELSVYIVQDAVAVSTRHPFVLVDLATDGWFWTASNTASIDVTQGGVMGGWGVEDLGANLRYWVRFQATAATTRVKIYPAHGTNSTTGLAVTGTTTYDDITMDALTEPYAIDFSTWTAQNAPVGWTKNTVKDNNAASFGGMAKTFATSAGVLHELAFTFVQDSNSSRRCLLYTDSGPSQFWFRSDTGAISDSSGFTTTSMTDNGATMTVKGRFTPAGTSISVHIYPSEGDLSNQFVASLTDSLECVDCTVTVV
jgi:hypothetical protein